MTGYRSAIDWLLILYSPDFSEQWTQTEGLIWLPLYVITQYFPGLSVWPDILKLEAVGYESRTKAFSSNIRKEHNWKVLYRPLMVEEGRKACL
jgi:hypothetical protein